MITQDSMSSIVDFMMLMSAIEPGSMRNITGISFSLMTIAMFVCFTSSPSRCDRIWTNLKCWDREGSM